MTNYYVNSGVTNGFDQQNRTWALNDLMYVLPNDATANAVRASPHAWKCTTAGTTTGVPVWPAAAITDGTTTITQNATVFTAQACTAQATANKRLVNMLRDANSPVVAGDTVYVDKGHNESLLNVGSSQTVNLNVGRAINLIKVICADFSTGSPPTAVATTASTQSSSGVGGFGCSPWLGSQNGFYLYGIKFKAGATGGNSSFDDVELQGTLGGGWFVEKCQFHILNDAAGDTSHFMPQGGSGFTNPIWLKNCDVLLTLSTQYILCGYTNWSGGSLLATTASTLLFGLNNGGERVLVEAVDLSAGPAAMSLFGNTVGGQNITPSIVLIRNCKLPASWSGSLTSNNTLLGGGSRVEMVNCAASGINYRYWCDTELGTIRDQEATLIRTGGASDGTTPVSHKVVTNASTKFPNNAIRIADLLVWNDATGTSKTATIEFLHDSLTALNNDDIWVDFFYAGDSGDPLWLIGTTRKADILTSNAAVGSSTAAWDTTGMTNPNKQKLAVTFTPQLKGYVLARVYIAKASYTLYVDPMVTVA